MRGADRVSALRPPQLDTLPGLPDALPAVPPKAREYEALTLDEVIARSHALVDEIQTIYLAERTYLLFSGGGDSSVLAHLMRERVDGFVHVDTGTAIPATSAYVCAVCIEWDVPLHVTRPDDSYEDLVLGRVKPKTDRGKRSPDGDEPLWAGFPGSAAHYLMYQRLKERALDKFRRSVVGPRGKTGQLVYLAGMRWAESDRRFRNAAEIDPAGAVVWCSPIVYWTDGHMAEYRARHMCQVHHQHAPHRLCFPGALPRSEVTEHLHMSGDCTCGCYAKDGELDEIGFFYPEVAARIRALEAKARDAGIARCAWGAGKQPGDSPARPAGRLCSSCVPLVGQVDITDEWLAAGLITSEQHAAMGGGAS